MSEEPLRVSFLEAARLDAESGPRIVGRKAAALGRMTALGLPVPPGFVLTTNVSRAVSADGWSAEIEDEVWAGVHGLEREMGRRMGDVDSPLLVSVRSGAAVSMPGVLATVLDVGIDERIADAMGVAAGDERFGWDTYRRFLTSFATGVLDIDDASQRALGEHVLGSDEGDSLSGSLLSTGVRAFRDELRRHGDVPDSARDQIRVAVEAVIRSWSSEDATAYREAAGLSHDDGTAVIIQAMTFGNLGTRSGAGVAFSRDPSTGRPGLVGDFIVGAQGQDVVAGTHPTRPLHELREEWPEVADELEQAARQLERDHADLVDIEFTVEQGRLWLLQARPAARSPQAAVWVAIDMANDPDISLTRAGALERVADLLEDRPADAAPSDPPLVEADAVLASGLAAAPGRVVGAVCTTIDQAIAAGERGDQVVLFRRETSPADIVALGAAAGLVTTLGGIASHGAVVARGFGIPAVVGVSGIEIDEEGITVEGERIAVGVVVTVDGDAGRVLRGPHAVARRALDGVEVLQAWRAELAGETLAAAAVDGGEAPTPAACERVLALKGAATPDEVARVLGCDGAAVEALIQRLIADGDARMLADGRVRLRSHTRARVDDRFTLAARRLATTIEPLLADFDAVNRRLKALVSEWQHAPGEAAGETIASLHVDVHPAVASIVTALAADEPRFLRYLDRLGGALDAAASGDVGMIADPRRESYHTVWFELHEELIRLSGRSRAEMTGPEQH